MARVYVENGRVVLEGFDLTNETTGGGLFCECWVTLRSCRVSVGAKITASAGPPASLEEAHARAGSIAAEARQHDDGIVHNILPEDRRN